MNDGSQRSQEARPAEPWVAEPEYRQGVIDLLGVLAYGALAAFDRLAEDARRAPALADKVYMASPAALQIAHFNTVRTRLAELAADVMVAMKPFHAPFNEFHAHTKPKDWPEGLVLAYVGNGFAADFYREVAAFVDADTRALVHQVLADEGHADFIIESVRTAIAADRRLSGRLAPWGRRLVGGGAKPGAASCSEPGCAHSSADGNSGPSWYGSCRDEPDVLPARREPHASHDQPRFASLGRGCFGVTGRERHEL